MPAEVPVGASLHLAILGRAWVGATQSKWSPKPWAGGGKGDKAGPWLRAEGEKAVAEAGRVPEGLCCSWASRSLGHPCLLPPSMAGLRGQEAFRIKPAAWWLRAESPFSASCTAAIPPRSAMRCLGLVPAGCTGTLVEAHPFPAGFVRVAPWCFEASSCPRARIRLPFTAWACWGLDVALQLRMTSREHAPN